MKNCKSIVAAFAVSLLSFVPARAEGYIKPYIGADAILSRAKSSNRVLPSVVAGSAFKFEDFYVEPEIRFNPVDNVYRRKRDDNFRIKDIYGLGLNLGYEFIDGFSFALTFKESFMQAKSDNINSHRFVSEYGCGFKYNISDELSVTTTFDTKKFKKSDIKTIVRRFAMGIRYNF